MHKSKWFVTRNFNPNPKIRLFCFPYAGGGASVYQNWQSELNDEIEVIAIQYPGREVRIREHPFEKITELVDSLYEEIIPHTELGDMAFFGHSMGTKVIYELNKKLQKNNKKLPFCIILSGARAPDIIPRFTIFNLERQDFINGLKLYKGTPAEILQDDNILKYFLPMLYADFKADETYQDSETVPFPCPLYLLGGENDIITSHEELRAWKKYAKNEYYERFFPGGHFFIKDQFSQVINYIKDVLLSELQNSVLKRRFKDE